MEFLARIVSLLLGIPVSLWNHRFLILQLVRSEVSVRYRTSLIGFLWFFVNPLVMLSIYTLVFGVVFQSRVPFSRVATNQQFEFGIFLFTGLIIFNLFAEVISRSTTIVISNLNYVKKVVFPLEVLPIVVLLVALVQAAANLIVLFVFVLIVYGAIPSTALLLPLIWLGLLPMLLGASWFLASIGVYLRDTGQLVGFFLTFLMFLGPLFYPASAMPERFRMIVALNPLTYPIEASRELLLGGNQLEFQPYAIFVALNMLVMATGWIWFNYTRKGFADVV